MSRYIDADFVANGLREVLHKPINEFPDEFEQAINCLVYAISILQFAPTADVAPVVHAHWKEYVDVGGAIYIECSACGLIWWLDEGTAEENEMFYCPKCGAKMDEEVDDGG